MQTGTIMDIATFASLSEEYIDARQLQKQGYHGTIVGYCLLSYKAAPADIRSYVSIMQQACTG
jgi:hypothetical protein